MIGEYIIVCPNCHTEVRLLAEMVSPVILYCNGCGRSVVLCENVIFTLPFEYIEELAGKHPIRFCGDIISTQISEVAEELINSDKIEELQNLLSQRLDVQDFINKIK